MATELSMNGRKKIETIQKEFTGKFPYLTLVFLDVKRQTIDISKSLSEVRKVKGDDVSIIASLKVNTLEKRFLDNFGIIVEVAYQKQEKLIFTKDNVNQTLNELNKWCSEHKCDKFQFAKSLKGNTLMSIQDQLLQAIKETYPLAEAKKINKDNFLDIFIPETKTKRGSHLFFNTSKGEIKIGFYCRDEEFIENVLSNSSNIEKYSQGIRILNNPLLSNVIEAVNNALSFINEIINSSETLSNSVKSFETNVDDEVSVEIDSKEDIGAKFRESYTDDEELAQSISSYLEDFSERGKIVVLEIKEKDLIKATEDHDLFLGELFTVIGVVDLKSWQALSKLIGKVESDWAKDEFKEEDPISITLLYSNGKYVYAYSVPKDDESINKEELENKNVFGNESEIESDDANDEMDNTSNLLNEFFENLILNFPSVELKEIKENDFVHIYMPDLYLDKEKSHLYFIIKNDKIEIGFYILDKDFINNVLQYSEKIEVNKNNLRLKGNPNFENDFPDAFDAAMTFIWEIQKCIASSLEVEDEDFSITEELDDFRKFDITEEDIINKLSQKIKKENVIPQLLFINSAFEELNSEIKSNHQAYFFTSDVLITDRELQGFLYVNMDGFYSNCLGDDMEFILSWDNIIDLELIEENDGVEIQIELDNGNVAPIKEENSKSLKILYSFYKNVWQKVVNEFKDQPIIGWNSVLEMGIDIVNFNSLKEYIEWSNEEIISNEKKGNK